MFDQIVCLLIERDEHFLYDTFKSVLIRFICKCVCVSVYSKSCKQKRMLAPYRNCTRYVVGGRFTHNA